MHYSRFLRMTDYAAGFVIFFYLPKVSIGQEDKKARNMSQSQVSFASCARPLQTRWKWPNFSCHTIVAFADTISKSKQMPKNPGSFAELQAACEDDDIAMVQRLFDNKAIGAVDASNHKTLWNARDYGRVVVGCLFEKGADLSNVNITTAICEFDVSKVLAEFRYLFQTQRPPYNPVRHRPC